eukprot:GHVU01215090.1.p1 GENE.GHVU01215090.1~~GHVU01215090.1.p1  ORF type:complete len:466 (-),score=76.76 GHVU01215090.1:1372-2574(-)
MVTEIAFSLLGGAAITGLIFAGMELYTLFKDEWARAHAKPKQIPPLEQFMSAIGIIPTMQTTDNPLGYAAFFYGGTTVDDLYFFDQFPEVMRMVIEDNNSVQKILVETMQNRYKESDLYNSEYPFVMDFLREERPVVTRQFTTDLRKSISGETPLNFLLKFIQPTSTNHYIENILLNQPKFAELLPSLLEKKRKIQTILLKRYTKQSDKYALHQEKLAEFKANKKDRTTLKQITKEIADSRYTNGIFVQHHSGDLHRINQTLYYLDNHQYGHFGFKYVHEDAIVNVLEDYNEQQIALAEYKASEQNQHLTDYEKLIVGQTPEEHKQQTIEQQQIADPNLSARENAILGGASGAAAASTPPRGKSLHQPMLHHQEKHNECQIKNNKIIMNIYNGVYDSKNG